MNYAHLLPEVEKIAREAGREIMKYYKNVDHKLKSDGSEVTDADYASEKIILAALEKLTPDIPIISEECVEKNIIPDISGGTFWTVDPLDGTRDFIEKMDGFAVAIALIVDHKPVLGVIDHPALGWMYSACGPQSAVKIDTDNNRHTIRAVRPENAPRRIVISRRYADRSSVEKFILDKLGTLDGVEGDRNILRVCQVAEGLAEMSVTATTMHDGRSSCWDVAPGHAIIEAAGGSIRTFDGNEVVYDSSDLRVPRHAIAVADY